MAPIAVFASTAALYHQAGWPAVLPVPPETKSPPPTGFTGAEGHDTPAELLASWAGNGFAQHSIALRMPDGIIGIDVDHYVTASGKAKHGADTLAEAIARWGELPPTWTSTARGAGPSRIAFYRVPPGRYATVIRPDIEIIQRHHRYAVVWPSPHSEVGAPYCWYGPDGQPADHIPGPHEFPELPVAWVLGLREGAAQASPQSASHASGEALLAALTRGEQPACSVMYDALDAAARVLQDPDVGTRHDAMTARVHRIVQTAAMGHPGFGVALPGLRTQWAELTTGEAREGEFDRMLLSSARKAVTVLGGVQQLSDPCEMLGGPTWASVHGVAQVDARPRPADDRQPSEDADEPFEPLRLELPPTLVDPSWRQVIGAQPFEPGVDLDHAMADAMLLRGFYMVRRASDMKSAWLLRGAEQWSLEGDLSGRLVSECVSLMPVGDPDLPSKKADYTAENRIAARRLRLMTNGPAAAVAATIKRHTDGGRHPATVRVTDLDREPDVLWAGGWPWDLRASRDAPALAEFVDPHGPHLAAAGVAPALVPTPRWDAYIAAVWPDAAVRAWALRVLSIAFTGYPDAALPILFGGGGTGKTSLVTLLMEVLGSYAHAADHRLLGSGEGHASIVFALKGRRLSFIDEAMREGTRNTERLKQLTGGGELTGNAMNQNPITFRPTHTLVLTSNTPPTVSDAAVRRRIRLLPCNGDPEEVRARRQALTAPRWAAEAPGVLAQMMREAAGWLAEPNTALTSAAPLAVQFLLGNLIQAQDVIAQWLDEAVMPDERGTPSHRLYVGFRGWCKDAGIKDSGIPTETAWGTALNELGFAKIQRRDANYRPLVHRPDPGYPGHLPPVPPGGASSPPRVEGVEGLRRVVEGRNPIPSTPHNPTSTPVSSSSVEGVEGSSTSFTYREVEKEPLEAQSESAVGKYPPPSTLDLEAGTSSQVGRVVEGTANPPHNPPQTLQPSTPASSQGADQGEFDLGLVKEAPDQAKRVDQGSGLPTRSRKVTNTDVAARAYQGKSEKQISKAEARAQLREEARQAAIIAAQGEVLSLPAVVDREQHVLPVTLDQAAAVVRASVARADQLDVDVETSGYPVGHPLYELRSVQLGDDIAAAVLHPVKHAELIRTLLAEAPALGAFSATADLVPIAHADLGDAEGLWERMHDVVIKAKLADPQSTGAAADGLKQISPAVLGAAAVSPAADEARAALFKAGKWLKETKVTTPIEKSGWAQVETASTVMLRYAASDVLDTAALARVLPKPDPRVYERERLAQRMTARVAHRGVRLDSAHIAELTSSHTAGREASTNRARAFGVDNPGSDQQVAAVALQLGATLPMTKTGRPSVAASVLEPLRAAEGPLGAFVNEVLDYRHHDTVLGLFLEPYRLLCEHGDGRARPTVYTVGTDTGRMSCVRPNLQQLSRQGGVRACITADPGQLMIGADFSGVEIRVAAALSQDPNLLQILRDGRDLHAEIALQVWGPDPELTAEKGVPTASKAHRYKAKPMVFGRIYGGGVPTLAAQAGVSHAVAQAVIDSLDALAPGLTAWSASIRNAVQRGHTQFESYSGRVIHLPRERPHAAPNYCVGMNTPVLRSDLTYVAASKIEVGDRLVGFDEHPQEGAGGANKYHHLRTAVVEAVSTVLKPSVKVRTNDGKVTECSTDHLWLVRPLKGRKNNRPRVRWVRADELQPGDDLLSLGTWDVADGRTAGYLAGLFDGEGYLARHAGGRRKNQLFFSQLSGPVMDAMQAGMAELGLPFSHYAKAPNSSSPTDSVAVSGLRNVMRTLGTLQPERFRPRFEEVYEGNAITAGLTESVQVIAIEPAGALELASIQTSTRTLVANGYLSHNCIQGSARELLVDALVRWRDTRWGNCTLFPVHDELDVFVPEADAEEATAELVRCMETQLYGVQIIATPEKPSFAWADSS